VSEQLEAALRAMAIEEAKRRGLGDLALDSLDVEVRPDVSLEGVLAITCLITEPSGILYYNLHADQITEPPEVVTEISTLLGTAGVYTGSYIEHIVPEW